MGCGGSTTKVEAFKPPSAQPRPGNRGQEGGRRASASHQPQREKSKSPPPSRAKSPSKRRKSSSSSSSSSSKKSSRQPSAASHHSRTGVVGIQREKTQIKDGNQVDDSDMGVIHAPAGSDGVVTRADGDERDEGVFDIDDPDTEGENKIPLVMPPPQQSKTKVSSTIDDVVRHNSEQQWREWFLYCKTVYDTSVLLGIVCDRMTDAISKETFYGKPPTAKQMLLRHHPVPAMRWYGLSKAEVPRVLRPCEVGPLLPIDRHEYLRRLKADVEAVKDEIGSSPDISEYLTDYLGQLSRWLTSYPDVQTENKTPASTSGNVSDAEFPLPEQIQNDRSVLRAWSESWEMFETTVPEEGAWGMYPLATMETLGDVHSIFANAISREDWEGFDTNVEGEAGWEVIPEDLYKNDTTTPEQDEIWKEREGREDLDDPDRMRRRRQQLANYFLQTHTYTKSHGWMDDFMNFSDAMEQNMVELNKVSESFDPASVPKPIVHNLPPPSEWNPNKGGYDQNDQGEGNHDGQDEGHQDDQGEGHQDDQGEGHQEEQGDGQKDDQGEGHQDDQGEGHQDDQGEGHQDDRGEGHQNDHGEGHQDDQGEEHQDDQGEGHQDDQGEGHQDDQGEGHQDDLGEGPDHGGGKPDDSGDQPREDSPDDQILFLRKDEQDVELMEHPGV